MKLHGPPAPVDTLPGVVTSEPRPVVHVTNFSSRGLHGPGRRLTIMACPRSWEHGEGRVPACTPLPSWLRDAQAGRTALPEYRALVEGRLAAADLRPQHLTCVLGSGEGSVVIAGDTLLCACARDKAARGECHRVWAATALRASGWDVILDGERLP
jgi:hypothetical protein